MSLPVFIVALAEAFASVSTATPAVFTSKNARFLSPLLLQIERATNVGGGTVYGAKLNGMANVNRNDFLGDGVSTTYQTNIPFAALSNNNWIVRIDKSTRTGTASVTAGSNAITGAGTAFTTELRVGQEVTINGERKVITAITSTTAATTDTNYVNTAAGASIFMNDDILVPTTDFTVSNVGGNALITIGAAAKAPLNAKFSVHFVVPAALYTFATATTTFAKREVAGADVLWYLSDATATPGATNIYVSDIGD